MSQNAHGSACGRLAPRHRRCFILLLEVFPEETEDSLPCQCNSLGLVISLPEFRFACDSTLRSVQEGMPSLQRGSGQLPDRSPTAA